MIVLYWLFHLASSKGYSQLFSVSAFNFFFFFFFWSCLWATSYLSPSLIVYVLESPPLTLALLPYTSMLCCLMISVFPTFLLICPEIPHQHPCSISPLCCVKSLFSINAPIPRLYSSTFKSKKKKIKEYIILLQTKLCSPPTHSYFEILNSVPQNVTIFEEQAFKKGN